MTDSNYPNSAAARYVELDRNFNNVVINPEDGDESGIGRAFDFGSRLKWIDLLPEHRLVVLAEAGAGKTEEIRHVARLLRAEGKRAFFLRLENIADDFEDAIEIGTLNEFEEWLASTEEAWLLLDSVDEARLRNPRDFETAIRRLGRRIKTAFDRTHVILTARTTAWRPKTDLELCGEHLPLTPIERVEKSTGSGPARKKVAKTERQDAGQPTFRIVSLSELDPSQIAKFAKARGLLDTSVFLDAIERADAWYSAERPQDLAELVEFWNSTGRIGSRLELLRNSIERRLVERDEDRAAFLSLTYQRARVGAKLIAAATTLMRNQTIRVPDGEANVLGLDLRTILPSWTPAEQATLLSRPIFDEAIYGTSRFHHRSVREFLAAEWFADLLAAGTSRRTIESLFFSRQYDIDVIVPTLRPILPWLCIFDERIRNRVRTIAPEVFFEGGDPTQLPIDLRRDVLREVCEQISVGKHGLVTPDYQAVERFADTKIAPDVRELLSIYSENDDLTAFLLRMVWLGRLEEALPEALAMARHTDAEHYCRLAALRAVWAVGSDADKESLREGFLAETEELNREILSEFVGATTPSEKTTKWLIACLEKSPPQARHSADNLANAVSGFVANTDTQDLPRLIAEFDRLMSLPPFVEISHCETSKRHAWLADPASRAVLRLIESRSPAALEDATLGVLRKIKGLRDFGMDDARKIRKALHLAVPLWVELNRALFWFEVRSARASGERITEHWQVLLLEPIVKFDVCDFDYAVEQIRTQALVDDKLVALSLAHELYMRAAKPNTWKATLTEACNVTAETRGRLAELLAPRRMTDSQRRWKRTEARWKQQDAARAKREAENRAKWKKHLHEELPAIRERQSQAPNLLYAEVNYLYEQTREDVGTGRWTDGDWERLATEFGQDVARFYRDAAVGMWRSYTPKLRSEGAPANETQIATIVGLTGLEIEAAERSNSWPGSLDPVEVDRACRHATFELNGFPSWLPTLLMAFPEQVREFLMKEIRYELSVEKPEESMHYVMSDVASSGSWAWDELAPLVFAQLKDSEPQNAENLDRLLNILRGSSLTHQQMEELAAWKCTVLTDPYHLGRWYAVWAGVAPDQAIASLRESITSHPTDERVGLTMTFVTHLWGGRRQSKSARDAFQTPGHLKALYILVHEEMSAAQEINRANTGVFSPGLRDDAQEARDRLFQLLDKIPGKESFLAIQEIARASDGASNGAWVRRRLKGKAEQDADLEPWTASQLVDFTNTFERTPATHRELAELALLRFLDMKDDLENGDGSVATILIPRSETEVRNYLGNALRSDARGRYSIPQEEELADAKRPDLRFLGAGFDAPVPAELKLADKWSGAKLFERLENQLCGDYLRDNRSSRGLFVLVRNGHKNEWHLPGTARPVDFLGLVAALQGHWETIANQFPGIDDVRVVGIDLTLRKRPT